MGKEKLSSFAVIMLVGYLGKNIGMKNWTTIRFWLIAIVLLFSFVTSNAQQTNPSKPQNNTNQHRTINNKQKKDSSNHKATTRAIAPTKKDTTHKSRNQSDSAHRTSKNILKKDSTKKAATLAPVVNHKDSTSRRNTTRQTVTQSSSPQKHFVRKKDPLWEKITTVPYLPLKAKPIYVMDEPHPYESKDILFFTVCGLFFLYGIVRTAFPKYTGSLFRNLVSFSSIDKSDYSMGQNNLPSLLLNILFCLSVGLLAALMIEELKNTDYPIWQVWLLGSIILASIYFVKFITIYASGWIFNASADANAYMYVVFMINKVIGVLSLPAILVFAFAENPALNSYIITIGGILLVVLLLYRYIVTFSVIARNLQLNAFHFFLYLCSVEIIPILVLYKLFSKDLINWI
ncbi:MAG: hypothetical protein DI598_01725 [Pseudopedobacter saltans]|uniref:DUF4271 domain-containing protein n=1 Tax=Pseudopedobacter saltans TaxID=151895 RepID=A0A2W5H1Y6_9SPHI|nr:MAG: hypothetical protein DI598_01725 [Pseudopedobacter saltans]